MKNKKHDIILQNYSKIKNKHLENLANNVLKNDYKLCQLKKYNINLDILNLF